MGQLDKGPAPWAQAVSPSLGALLNFHESWLCYTYPLLSLRLNFLIGKIEIKHNLIAV